MVYLNGKGKPVTQETAEPFNVNAHILDRDNEPRKIVQIGHGHYVSHKQGWLNKIAKDNQVDCRFLLLGEEQYGILLTTPNKEEKHV